MNSGSEPDVGAILKDYPTDCRPQRLEPLGSCGGLSGAQFWRLESPRGVLCLRQWPAVHPSPDRLAWIHQALRFAAPQCSFSLPLPIETKQGDSFIQASGHPWEMTPWLPGAPASRSPLKVNKLQLAMAALAEMHRALAGFAVAKPGNSRLGDSIPGDGGLQMGPAPGILKRLSIVRTPGIGKRQPPSHAMSGGRRLSAEVVELALVFDAAGEGLAKQAERDLTSAGRLCVPLQMCLRDVWRPHVLFQENIVTGMVDFGAMDVDCVAGDVARLLGSLTGNDEEGWRIGVAAYEAIRPLSEPERALIPAYDRSGVLLSAANWLRWLLDEDRTFPDESVALERLVELAGRLRAHEL